MTDPQRVRHVGWLSDEHDYRRGSIDQAILSKLECICVNSGVNQARGFYYCRFCDAKRVVAECDGRQERLGSAEIWVPSGDKIIYAAPDLICHYIGVHEYMPPEEFVEAVRALDVETYDAESVFAEVVEARFR